MGMNCERQLGHKVSWTGKANQKFRNVSSDLMLIMGDDDFVFSNPTNTHPSCFAGWPGFAPPTIFVLSNFSPLTWTFMDLPLLSFIMELPHSLCIWTLFHHYFFLFLRLNLIEYVLKYVF